MHSLLELRNQEIRISPPPLSSSSSSSSSVLGRVHHLVTRRPFRGPDNEEIRQRHAALSQGGFARSPVAPSICIERYVSVLRARGRKMPRERP